MDSLSKLNMERSENELRLAKALLMLSENESIKKQLQAEPADTFYSAVISHAYYAIFYCTMRYSFNTIKKLEIHQSP